MSTRLLAIETATEACSAALWVDGSIHQQYTRAANRHAELLLPMIERVLAAGSTERGQLDAVAFGRGPGAFTGLRIGAGIAQGLAFGCDIPVLPVSSLQALAQQHPADRVAAAIDARMDQLYWACFERGSGIMQAMAEERVSSPQQVEIPVPGEWLLVGDGWDRYLTHFESLAPNLTLKHIPRVFPRAWEVAELGALAYRAGLGLPPEQAQPVYVRNRVVNQPKDS